VFGLAGKRSTKSTSGSVRRASVTKNQTETKNKRAVKKSPVKKSTVRKNTEKKSVYNEYFDEKEYQTPEENFLAGEILIIVDFAVSVLLFIGIFGLGGTAGRFFKDFQLGLFGVAGYLFPVIFFVGVAFLISNKASAESIMKAAAGAGILLCVSGIMHSLFGKNTELAVNMMEFYNEKKAGGIIGALLYSYSIKFAGKIGTVVLMFSFLAICIICISERSFVNFVSENGSNAYRHIVDDLLSLRKKGRQYEEDDDIGSYDEDYGSDDIFDKNTGKNGDLDYNYNNTASGGCDIDKIRYPKKQNHIFDFIVEPAKKLFLKPDDKDSGDDNKGFKAESVNDKLYGVDNGSNDNVFSKIAKMTKANKALYQNAPHDYKIKGDKNTGKNKGFYNNAFYDKKRNDDTGITVISDDGVDSDNSEIFTGKIIRAEDYNNMAYEDDPLDEETIRKANEILARKEALKEGAESEFAKKDSDNKGHVFTSSQTEDTADDEFEEIFLQGASKTDEKAGFNDNMNTDTAGDSSDSLDDGISGYKSNNISDDISKNKSGSATVDLLKDTADDKGYGRTAGNRNGTDRDISDVSVLKNNMSNKKIPNIMPGNTTAAYNKDKHNIYNKDKHKHKKMHKKYIFPSTELLKKAKPPAASDDAEYRSTALKLKQTLHNFGVDVSIGDISCGPTVTRYEIQPEQGVKVSRIVSLADDIKLNLAASDIRIEAPIPGKAAVGIEVPNKENTLVHLRELIESHEFRYGHSELSFALGRDISGKPIFADIARMPHLLIAGATGSGKSVCINTLIMSILFKYSPEEVRMIMVDPKVVELSVYNGIPHLLIPVVTDPKKAAAALNWAVSKMAERYKLFAKSGVRDLKGYNEKMKKTLPKEEFEVMPQIIIIIDELADLMMVAHNEVEDHICRLAQLARACGIHLVIATQRPSVNVITGLIKANIPSRIAFAVSSAIDSRTILDGGGAEKLLGKGDMLFDSQSTPKPVRIQGAFVSDKEVSDVVAFINANCGVNDYDKEVAADIEEAGTGNKTYTGSERDELFSDVGRCVIKQDNATIGYIQRLFKLGFNRAARIMDQLEAAGVVETEQGTKKRSITMTLDEFEKIL